MIKIDIMSESDIKLALYGLGKNKGLTSMVSYKEFTDNAELVSKALAVASRLGNKDGGHNKFLESMIVWINVRTTRYVWQEADTYRVGMTKQSDSTMHTLMKRHITINDCDPGVDQRIIDVVNELIDEGNLSKAKKNLPEGFLQERVLCTNYKTLRHIYSQRKNHRLQEWKDFCKVLETNLNWPDFITGKPKEELS